MQYLDNHDMANDQPPLHDHRDHAIDNYAGAALDVPAQAQAAPPDPVCTDLPFSAYAYLTSSFGGGD